MLIDYSNHMTIKKEGTGLGLSIVKRIIEDYLAAYFLPGRKMKGSDHFGAEAKIILPMINSQNKMAIQKLASEESR